VSDSQTTTIGTPEADVAAENFEFTAWHYKQGQWVTGPDPVWAAWTDGDEESMFLRLGYRELFSVGDRFGAGFTVWEHGDRSRHVIATGIDECTRFFYVDEAPAVRDICARWAAVARDEIITSLISDLLDPDSRLTESVIRRAVRGLR
jgi:hypothetical protein